MYGPLCASLAAAGPLEVRITAPPDVLDAGDAPEGSASIVDESQGQAAPGATCAWCRQLAADPPP